MSLQERPTGRKFACLRFYVSSRWNKFCEACLFSVVHCNSLYHFILEEVSVIIFSRSDDHLASLFRLYNTIVLDGIFRNHSRFFSVLRFVMQVQDWSQKRPSILVVFNVPPSLCTTTYFLNGKCGQMWTTYFLNSKCGLLLSLSSWCLDPSKSMDSL